jgi:hypothetical protein
VPSRSKIRRFIHANPVKLVSMGVATFSSNQRTDPDSLCDRFSRNIERNDCGGFRFQQNGIRSTVFRDGASEAESAAAFSGFGCDCDNVGLRNGDPGTTEYCHLSGGGHRLPSASQLVSTWLGVNGALSVRHLCLWTFLLSRNLLLLSGSLPVPASLNSCRAPGPPQAISASWLVVVKMRSWFRR